jgi:hypothetical protein
MRADSMSEHRTSAPGKRFAPNAPRSPTTHEARGRKREPNSTIRWQIYHNLAGRHPARGAASTHGQGRSRCRKNQEEGYKKPLRSLRRGSGERGEYPRQQHRGGVPERIEPSILDRSTRTVPRRGQSAPGGPQRATTGSGQKRERPRRGWPFRQPPPGASRSCGAAKSTHPSRVEVPHKGLITFLHAFTPRHHSGSALWFSSYRAGAWRPHAGRGAAGGLRRLQQLGG